MLIEVVGSVLVMLTNLMFRCVGGDVSGGEGTIVVVVAVLICVFSSSGSMTALAPCPIASTHDTDTSTTCVPPVTSCKIDVLVESRITA